MGRVIPSAPPVSRMTRVDQWWARVLASPARFRAWYWGGPLGVTLVAAILRLWNLGHPAELVFDETFYVKDAYTLLNLGYEAEWPAQPDPQFNRGETDIFSTSPSFVVHPPLGKWIIALGLALFGADTSFGWRIAGALCGVLAVLLIALIGRSLFRSTLLGTLAGFLFAIDGHAIVMSRIAILDGILMVFCLAGFGFMLLDRGWQTRRLERWARTADRSGFRGDWGPALWARPWLIAAAATFGLASAVKWSGLYFLAAFGLYSVVVDALTRRRLGMPLWFSAAVLKQAPVNALLMLPVAAITYLITWTGWFATSGGYYRSWAQTDGEAWSGALSWVPLSVQNFWHYQTSIYSYHVAENSPHPYSANPLTWLFMIRPTQMYVRTIEDGQSVCGADTCYENVTSVANAVIWWGAVAALVYLVVRGIRQREWQIGFILVGLAAGYLPWLMYLNRTVYQFYTIVFEPYLVLGLVFVLGLVLGSRDNPPRRRWLGIGLVAGFVVVAIAVSAFFWPVWTGQPISGTGLVLHYWLPSWR